MKIIVFCPHKEWMETVRRLHNRYSPMFKPSFNQVRNMLTVEDVEVQHVGRSEGILGHDRSVCYFSSPMGYRSLVELAEDQGHDRIYSLTQKIDEEIGYEAEEN